MARPGLRTPDPQKWRRREGISSLLCSRKNRRRMNPKCVLLLFVQRLFYDRIYSDKKRPAKGFLLKGVVQINGPDKKIWLGPSTIKFNRSIIKFVRKASLFLNESFINILLWTGKLNKKVLSYGSTKFYSTDPCPQSGLKDKITVTSKAWKS